MASSSPSTGSAPLLSTARKEEIFGVLCMTFAALLALAFVSYHPADDLYLQQVSFFDAMFGTPEDGTGTLNWLGYMGAMLAWVFVPNFMGYPALVLCGLLAWLGFRVFRHQSLVPMLGPALNALGVAVFICVLLGWVGQAFGIPMVRWGGALGVTVAAMFTQLLGIVGTLLVLTVVAVVGGLLATEGDVQGATDRLIVIGKAVGAAIATGAQHAWTWIQARYAEWQNRPHPQHGTPPEEEETASDTPRIKDPTEPNAPGFRLVRSDAEPSPEDETDEAPPNPEAPAPPPDAAGEPSAPAQHTPATAKASPEEVSPEEDSSKETPASETPGSPSPSARSAEAAQREEDASRPDAPAVPDADQASEEEARPEKNPGVIRFDDVSDRIRAIAERVGEEQARRRARREREADSDAERPETEQTSAGNPAPTSQDHPENPGAHDDSSRDEESGEELSGENPSGESPAARDTPSSGAAPSARTNPSSTRADADHSASEPSERASAAPHSSNPSSDTPESPAEPVTLQADPDAPNDMDMQVQPAEREEAADDVPVEPETAPQEPVPYEPPPLDLLDASTEEDPAVDYEELETNKQILLDTLATHNIEIQDITAVVGPTITRYEMTPAPGIKLSRIKSLEDDLAMAMAARSIRILAPIPGKSAVGVEIPNRSRQLVRLRDVIATKTFRDADLELPLPLGVSIEGRVFLADLTKMPHLLIAGATGSGKSVGLNALIMGMIYACHPSDVKFVIIDPKKIELQQYALLEDHFMARPADIEDTVITNVDEACGVLKSCEEEMEKRYDLLQDARVRNIRAYNRKWAAGDLDAAAGHQKLPYVVVIVDELADLMMTAGDDIEGPIARLAQKARAVGIHLILATQRPSVDVITGLIKANFPSRLAFEVASRVDSRTILDQIGAERLVGNGDLLFLRGSSLQRLQGPFVSVEEVERINGFIGDQPPMAPYTLPSLQESGHGPDVLLGVEDTDELFEEAAYIIVRRQQGSVSLLQRKLAIGYTRAARIVDQLEEAGIVGPFAGTKARDVLVDSEDELRRLFEEA